MAQNEYEQFLEWKRNQHSQQSVTGIPPIGVPQNERPTRTFPEVLKDIVNRVRFSTEQEVRDAHATIDEWWDEHQAHGQDQDRQQEQDQNPDQDQDQDQDQERASAVRE